MTRQEKKVLKQEILKQCQIEDIDKIPRYRRAKIPELGTFEESIILVLGLIWIIVIPILYFKVMPEEYLEAYPFIVHLLFIIGGAFSSVFYFILIPSMILEMRHRKKDTCSKCGNSNLYHAKEDITKSITYINKNKYKRIEWTGHVFVCQKETCRFKSFLVEKIVSYGNDYDI